MVRDEFHGTVADIIKTFELCKRLAAAESQLTTRGAGPLETENARIHFWKIAAHLYSIRRTLDACCDMPVLWDLGGVASLSRAVMDSALGLAYWLDRSHPDEYGAKFRLSLYHGANRELQMLRAIDAERVAEMSERERMVREARRGLESDPIFAGRYTDRLRKAIKGDLPRLLSNEEIAARAGLNLTTLDVTWRLLSMHAHGHPHSISSLRQFGAADADSRRLMASIVRFALLYAHWAIDLFLREFPVLSEEIIDDWKCDIEASVAVLRAPLPASTH
jgi:hypothetical protein